MLKRSISAHMKGGSGSMKSRKASRDIPETRSETNFTNVSHKAKIFKQQVPAQVHGVLATEQAKFSCDSISLGRRESYRYNGHNENSYVSGLSSTFLCIWNIFFLECK